MKDRNHAGLAFERLTCGIIIIYYILLYYYILYIYIYIYYYYILYITIISYYTLSLSFFLSFLFCSSFTILLIIPPSSIPPFLSSLLLSFYSLSFSFPPLLLHPLSPSLSFSSLLSFKVYVSAFGYPYLCSRLITILTPHKLTEWMVEVCGAYLCGVLVGDLSWWVDIGVSCCYSGLCWFMF